MSAGPARQAQVAGLPLISLVEIWPVLRFPLSHPGIIGYELVISVHEAFLKVYIINKFVLAGERAFYPVSLALPLENTPASPGMPAIRLTGLHICHSGY